MVCLFYKWIYTIYNICLKKHCSLWKTCVLYLQSTYALPILHVKPVCSWVTYFKKYAKAQDMKSLFRICFFCYFNNGSQKSELINCFFIEELVKKGFGVGRHLHFWMNDGTASKVVFFLKRDTKKRTRRRRRHDVVMELSSLKARKTFHRRFSCSFLSLIQYND